MCRERKFNHFIDNEAETDAKTFILQQIKDGVKLLWKEHIDILYKSTVEDILVDIQTHLDLKYNTDKIFKDSFLENFDYDA